ncbi:MAG TPA: hypothetical protein IAB61_03345 [Candidatus Merdisoma merdipullorum]|nr:hypothetical protein [Candidatus Merdisoma merdipullorum]
MAHELLSVKLCELDEKFERLHSRIQLSQTSDKSSLQKETQLVRRECEEEELILRRRLKFSKSEMAGKLSEVYEKMEETVQSARKEVESGQGTLSPEEWLLLAEYSLDFAKQAADRALLISLEAIGKQAETD